MATEIGSYNSISVTQCNRGHRELGLEVACGGDCLMLSRVEAEWLASVLASWVVEQQLKNEDET